MMVDICFYANFISNGVISHTEGLPLLTTTLKSLIYDDEEHRNIDIIWSFFVWCGADFAGLVSQDLEQNAADCHSFL